MHVLQKWLLAAGIALSMAMPAGAQTLKLVAHSDL